ncbi:hypothetical protein B0H16DRAFT_1719420 [Mycena metata]|uniref:Uncharacterized protein n=1 Tax=Mycena metata TaxID=1033252 RepID=A0AAD7JFR3_9AGAR|nr:hypothetical protein B0H16DRAFT_1719420 [Mycena metata]
MPPPFPQPPPARLEIEDDASKALATRLSGTGSSKAELVILITASKIQDKFFGCFRVSRKSKAKSIAPAATRTTAPKRTKKPAEGELDGIRMDSPEGAFQNELTGLANTADDDDMVISLDDADLAVPSVNTSEESLNSCETTI